eukprot:CAMPEP_0172592652 /NCGR_PEP_ID=MMETSP1068-20121228/11678_1 /TAXON_ID=35684 /ORGANISM="Pseudopedinella elastica, Strain CCMP716" /LENGTH=230 /DNA_ID=CAMNT_0013389753 /DNA_START=163 /DNA_END=855 /DNA_ORIENTATION=-
MARLALLCCLILHVFGDGAVPAVSVVGGTSAPAFKRRASCLRLRPAQVTAPDPRGYSLISLDSIRARMKGGANGLEPGKLWVPDFAFSDHCGSCEFRVVAERKSKWLDMTSKPSIARLELRLVGFGSFNTTRAAVEALSSELDAHQFPEGGIPVVVDMVHSTACSPRTLPVVVGFIRQFSQCFSRVSLVGQGPAMDTARAAIFITRLSRFRVFPNYPELEKAAAEGWVAR